MPQGGRSQPFSGTKKKQQLQAKRQKKAGQGAKFGSEDSRPSEHEVPQPSSSTVVSETEVKADLSAPLVHDMTLPSGRGEGRERFELRFQSESKDEIQKLKIQANQPLVPIRGDWALETGSEDFFLPALAFPQRPNWDNVKSKAAVEASEAKYFREYVQGVFQAHPGISYFELNLETWRQLWRVLEMSDVVLITVDIRYATAMFPPSIYSYIHELGKNVILVLNKVDLVPVGLALAWCEYFQAKYPGLQVTFFTSCPTYNLRTRFESDLSGLKHRRLRGRISMVKEGAEQVLAACRSIVNEAGADIDLDSWERLIQASDSQDGEQSETVQTESGESEANRLSHAPLNRFQDKILTIGMVGQPNAGKSSLINSLMGKRVVSVSKTPGHTKHFQTIFITKSVKLCDCPGLVFPSQVAKALQSIMGSFPISQIREPLSVVAYLASRVDLVQLLKLSHPEGPDNRWSALDVCEAWALKRGYVTARSNRPDLNRSANHILRMTLEGKICLSYFPIGYVDKREYWRDRPECEQIKDLLGYSGKPQAKEEVYDMEDATTTDDEDDAESGEEEDMPPSLGNKFSLLGACDE